MDRHTRQSRRLAYHPPFDVFHLVLSAAYICSREDSPREVKPC
jgi:hypothetical protein